MVQNCHVEVREIELDDLANVFHLGEKLFTSRLLPNMYRTWEEYEVVDLYQTDPELCLAAEADGQLVGFALGTIIEKRQSAWTYGYLVWLGVDPKYNKCGIATKLFKEMKERLEEAGANMLLVDTEADNLAALRFFEKMGFTHPQEHIYLSLNLSAERRKKQLRKNGKAKTNGNGGKNARKSKNGA